jgi:hypothetical protein
MPENTNFDIPAAAAAFTIDTPMPASSGAKAGLMWNTPSTPSTAARRLPGSRRSPMAISRRPPLTGGVSLAYSAHQCADLDTSFDQLGHDQPGVRAGGSDR